MRKIKSLILAVLILVFSFSLYSCNDGNLKQTISIEKLDENKIQALYVGKEYDASTIFVQENGIKYEINSLFYFDKNFDKINIPFTGFKFTQSENYDVSVVIKATKDKSVTKKLFELKANKVKENEDIDYEDSRRSDSDNLEWLIVKNTTSSVFSQALTQRSENVKEGLQSIKFTYGEKRCLNNTYYVKFGGIALATTETTHETIYDKFSAFNRETRSYYSSDKKTYVGFWVKNSTGKQLTVKFNLILWGENVGRTIVTNSKAINSLDDGMVIDGNDCGWHYNETELNNIPVPVSSLNPIIRTGLTASIKNPEEGDVFFVDALDIYHGSKI